MTTIHSATPQDTVRLMPMILAFMAEEGIHTAEANIASNLDAMLAHPSAMLWIVLSETGDPIGFMTSTQTVGLEFGKAAELEDLYVIPSERGKGLARQIVAAALDWAEAQCVRELILFVTPDGQSQGLQTFYEKLGFAPVDRLMFARSVG
ncbi:MAG: GNAT family N-acetyltransferase [Alphaproteobacteria bacterium]